jgi:hypothetical protein
MPIIAIDFDGCIVENKYPEIGEALPWVINAINALYNSGFCIIINSCRAREHEIDMQQWLEYHGINFCHINENCQERIVDYRTDCRKISADLYIDDKGLMAPNFNSETAWHNIVNLIYLKFGDFHRRRCEIK